MNIHPLCFTVMWVTVLYATLTSDHHQRLERCYVEWQWIEFHGTPTYDKKP